jgi:hypothetical protein
MSQSKPINPPILWPAVSTPDTEAVSIKDLNANLMGVTYNVEAWRAALDLFKFSKNPAEGVSRKLAREWGFIACHECVMQLYYLKERLKIIKGFKVRPCGLIAQCVDDAQMRKATNLLDSSFPDIVPLRDAIAHAGSVGTNPTKHSPPDGFGLIGFHQPDRFTAPYLGINRHLEITDRSLDQIRSVVTEFFAAFQAAAQELERLGHAP